MGTARQHALVYSKSRQLDLTRRETRLVHLHPGRWLDRIVCSLSTVSLDDDPEFEALSYAWGDKTRPRFIVLNGHTIPITTNLWAVLRRLRREHDARVLWIDALCIDQKNIQERNHQVQQMGNIYKAAFCVLAWIGEQSEDSDEAIDLLEALAEDVHWDQSPVYEGDQSPEYEVRKDHYERLASRREKRFQKIDNLLQRDWWRRIWCIQEINLARRAILICGGKEITYTRLCSFCEMHSKHETCCAKFIESFRYINEREHKSLSLWFVIIGFRTVSFDASSVPLLLDVTSGYLCTDPRDKVYGILAIADLGGKIVPNYSLSTQEVYQQTTLAVYSRI